MSARSRALIPQRRTTGRHAGGGCHRTTSSSGTHTFSMALCHRFLSLPEWQSPDFADRSPLFAPALTKEEFHGNRLLWLAAVDKLIESFGKSVFFPCHPMRGTVCSRPCLFVKVSVVVRKPR